MKNLQLKRVYYYVNEELGIIAKDDNWQENLAYNEKVLVAMYPPVEPSEEIRKNVCDAFDRLFG